MKILLNFLNTVFLTGCSVFGVPSVEEAGFDVLKDNAHFQVRQYKPLIVAQIEVDANYDEASNQAFNRLFKYISGYNKKRQKISMAAPVIMGAKSRGNRHDRTRVPGKIWQILVDAICVTG